MIHFDHSSILKRMRTIFRSLIAVAAIAGGATMLTGCVGDFDYGWNPTPPYGWNNTFYDSALTGCWRLAMVNSQPVAGYQVNYMSFDGRGRGEYFYYDNGRRYVENTAYWCQRSSGGNSYYQVNIQYETSGSPTTMNYWFTDNGDTLWMQWRNSYGLQTYIYYYQDYLPW